MNNKKILLVIITSITILMSSKAAFASLHASLNYTLLDAGIVVASGKGNSTNYIIDSIRIGNSFGGIAKSTNHILDLNPYIKTVIPPAVLSISISPNMWNIEKIGAGTTTTMRGTERIVVTNDGNTREDFALSLVNPDRWTADSQPGPNKFVLNAAFSSDPQNIIWDERNHLVTTEHLVSTQTRFAGDQNGINVLPGEGRSLFLQFKSPTKTQVLDSESIRLIISCEVPKD
jgi:hypothetical protein